MEFALLGSMCESVNRSLGLGLTAPERLMANCSKCGWLVPDVHVVNAAEDLTV